MLKAEKRTVQWGVASLGLFGRRNPSAFPPLPDQKGAAPTLLPNGTNPGQFMVSGQGDFVGRTLSLPDSFFSLFATQPNSINQRVRAPSLFICGGDG